MAFALLISDHHSAFLVYFFPFSLYLTSCFPSYEFVIPLCHTLFMLILKLFPTHGRLHICPQVLRLIQYTYILGTSIIMQLVYNFNLSIFYLLLETFLYHSWSISNQDTIFCKTKHKLLLLPHFFLYSYDVKKNMPKFITLFTAERNID